MTVLLLRLAGPLQAWGSSSRFVQRTTENAPTKSGILGLLAAAEGRPRGSDLSDLTALRFGVRIDQPGSRIKDFHKAENTDTGRVMPLSDRYYLADAVFLAGVEGGSDVIRRLHDAVRTPRFLPYLGRRSCPPSLPLLPDLVQPLTEAPLEAALRNAPWQASQWYVRQVKRTAARDDTPGVHTGPDDLDLLLDCPTGELPDYSLRDLPLTFDPNHRKYAMRGVRIGHVSAPADHDPTGHLRPMPTAGPDAATDPAAGTAIRTTDAN
ncbi:type I-E CRISPR-associated protein Cas5/CasD [Mangrovactinospora gilvigrisea]|uniref:Type I-E CRISPR-associated protein Cas5/CasD n=1 Tax=Mangrovactinospora gilvigrisea TaxID=1428644 RepID=A0A1J7BKF6_9ACTN|nr:type I-E CRISPR-associated protein Cas5/CasD [Mangrovactinospora gilvigrisea]OIV39171.1 type I-E CRISPR-associated protein Cas5/CasD [Mangrovactinospora gilvigrisea]